MRYEASGHKSGRLWHDAYLSGGGAGDHGRLSGLVWLVGAGALLLFQKRRGNVYGTQGSPSQSARKLVLVRLSSAAWATLPLLPGSLFRRDTRTFAAGSTPPCEPERATIAPCKDRAALNGGVTLSVAPFQVPDTASACAPRCTNPSAHGARSAGTRAA